jgi:membrane protease YdiL (CAAX protease family)
VHLVQAWPAVGRALLIACLAVGIEWSRVLAMRAGADPALALAAGGLALFVLAVGRNPADLGLGTSRIGRRLLGGLALAAVLLLPAAARWTDAPHVLTPLLAVAAVTVSIGEEVAFRGVLYEALDKVAGPAAAVIGSTLAFTVAHVISHPPAFLPAVAAAGLLLGLWRWACKDLVAPITAHVLADLSL